MNAFTKESLKNAIVDIEAGGEALMFLEDSYGEKLNAMNVEHEELCRLRFDLGKIANDLGNLSNYIRQYIKEEEAWEDS